MQTQFIRSNRVYVTMNSISELSKAINALETLGYEIQSIQFAYRVYIDWDTRFYHRYNDAMISRADWRCNSNLPLAYRNGKLYVAVDNLWIPIPSSVRNLNSDWGITIDFQLFGGQ